MGSVIKRFDIVAARKYQTRDGTAKTHWINCGEGAQWDDGGISLRLHAIPCGSWFDGTLRLFEREEKSAAKAPVSKAHREDLDDEIPF
ncbi:MAG: hypothetical protein ACREQ5_04990 [Candidatus Dormibacteria bacterium]